MDNIGSYFHFFVDKKISVSRRIFVFIIILLVAFLVNNFLGFTFYYSTNQKINQIEKIESIKQQFPLEVKTKSYLCDIESRIVHRENLYVRSLELFSHSKIDNVEESAILRSPCDSLASVTCQGESSVQNRSNTSGRALRSGSRLWHTITSTWVFLLIMLVLPFAPFFIDDVDRDTVLGIILMFLLAFGCVWLFQYLLGLLPVFGKIPIYNYMINVVIQFLIGWLLAKWFNKQS